jgi:hypothetical protein
MSETTTYARETTGIASDAAGRKLPSISHIAFLFAKELSRNLTLSFNQDGVSQESMPQWEIAPSLVIEGSGRPATELLQLEHAAVDGEDQLERSEQQPSSSDMIDSDVLAAHSEWIANLRSADRRLRYPALTALLCRSNEVSSVLTVLSQFLGHRVEHSMLKNLSTWLTVHYYQKKANAITNGEWNAEDKTESEKVQAALVESLMAYITIMSYADATGAIAFSLKRSLGI